MDFESYWAAVDDELAVVPARAVLESVAERSTAESVSYTVRLTSSGPYRVFGHLSIPSGPGPFPALLMTPRYGSVNHVPHPNDRSRYVVFGVMHRGQRLADESFAAAYPGLLTLGIDEPASYIYRGIVADCLRAAEFLFGLAEVDPARVAVSGDDLALLTAARRPGFGAVRLSELLFYRAMEARLRSSLYPLEELNDHLRAGAVEEQVLKTLSFFDPVRHASAVSAPTLVAADDADWFAPLIEALPASEVYQVTHLDGTDNDALDAWLADRFGVPPMSRFVRP
ncbi:cephalosporin-C deacetylase-like acetyl esterase [Kribbella sp. VKM Ac-2527]|uniref:Cephalosporin-C deacetylase-like acetyl esterase n=1 Tax=Kribbella caucasensis TaxID=2512215 RepID=A0A4R6KAU2_9ACTN|nr:acetylxylan esterase [Kribbella sp. VKM Ac-2527]TDO44648.1 cephalosporin-C deacetylase-like acetyl esterase [Kribbella sp. VKM Ac-2527]